MMRRIWVAILAVALLAALLPAPLFAEETASTQADNQLARIAVRLNTNVTRIVIAAPPQLQDGAQQGSSGSFWSSKRGKVTLAVAIIAASVAGGIAIAQGPDPRPWP